MIKIIDPHRCIIYCLHWSSYPSSLAPSVSHVIQSQIASELLSRLLFIPTLFTLHVYYSCCSLLLFIPTFYHIIAIPRRHSSSLLFINTFYRYIATFRHYFCYSSSLLFMATLHGCSTSLCFITTLLRYSSLLLLLFVTTLQDHSSSLCFITTLHYFLSIRFIATPPQYISLPLFTLLFAANPPGSAGRSVLPHNI